MPSTIKVLIVDDSALIRQMLTRALSVDPRIEIVGVAKTGVEAIEKARSLRPDVITLDIEMPELTGIEAIPHIAKSGDARIVMLSSLHDPDTTYQALSAGAVDFISKPQGGFATSLTDLSEVLLKKIKTAYRIDPHHASGAINEPIRAGSETVRRPPPEDGAEPLECGELGAVVAIGASTGGPPALERVFTGLSGSLPAAYFIVQHLPAGFSASLARRLAAVGDIEVVEASDGMSIDPGRGYLAPHGAHMTVRTSPASGDPVIRLQDFVPEHGVCPAVDPLFKSIAAEFGSRSVGVVLTGMGSDGAVGLTHIKDAGGETIAQNEETSVVWGMPAAAARAGAVRHLVPIGLIAVEIRRVLRGKGVC